MSPLYVQAVRGRCDLILDTTYCSPEYAFPSQAEVGSARRVHERHAEMWVHVMPRWWAQGRALNRVTKDLRAVLSLTDLARRRHASRRLPAIATGTTVFDRRRESGGFQSKDPLLVW